MENTSMPFSLGGPKTGSLLNSLRWRSVLIKDSCVLGLTRLFMTVAYYKTLKQIMEMQNVIEVTFSKAIK